MGTRLAELNKLVAETGDTGVKENSRPLKQLAEELREDEEPLALVKGVATYRHQESTAGFWTKDYIGVALVTNERLIYQGWTVGRTESASLPISTITSANVGLNILKSKLAVVAAGSTFEMKNFPLEAGKRVIATINEAIATPATDRPSAPDPLEQLKVLGELRDSGVLTAEEFEQKKAELLDRL